jgi:hypothetical protein
LRTGSFLFNNYKQALSILNNESGLEQAMRDLHVSHRTVFEDWRAEERRYLESLVTEPIVETLEMEYYQKLVELYAAEYVPHFLVVFMLTSYRKKLEAARQVWINSTPDKMSQRDTTRLQETQRRHALEERDKLLCVVHDLELKLGITERWQRGSAKWSATKKMVANRTYQRCLDRLEGLVVARMFELTKMNQSKTGMFIHSNTTISDMFARLQAPEAHCKGPSDTITSYSHCYR